MIVDEFGDRTKANMKVALIRACERLGSNGHAYHQPRSYVARKLLDCAHGGHHTLGALTKTGTAAATETDEPVADHHKMQI
jgi:hypothetical protein